MKRIVFLTSFLLCLTHLTFAQKSAIDKAVDSCCKCLEAIKDKIKSPADFDKYGQGCIVKGAMPFINEISKEEQIPIEDLDEDIGEKLGQKIGLKLVSECTVFLELIAQYASEDEEEDAVTGKVSGVVSSVDIMEYVYLNIKESSGKVVKVIWVEYFSGSDDFKNDPALLKGKNVEASWKQAEIYNISQKDFITVKKLTSLKLK